MTAQRAAFTMMGDSFLALDQQFEGRLIQEGVLMKIALGPDTYDKTGEFLRLMGITEFTFFPDLDGLGRRIKAEAEAVIGDAKRLFPESFKSI
jgi:hypothetical protein